MGPSGRRDFSVSNFDAPRFASPVTPELCAEQQRSAIGFTKPEERHQCHGRRRHHEECGRYFVAGAFRARLPPAVTSRRTGPYRDYNPALPQCSVQSEAQPPPELQARTRNKHPSAIQGRADQAEQVSSEIVEERLALCPTNALRVGRRTPLRAPRPSQQVGTYSVIGKEVLQLRRREQFNSPAPEDGLLFLHYLDVFLPDRGGRFAQSECALGELQIVSCKRHQIFGHALLSTLLGEPYAPFG
jgi:hypothetical protein